MAPAGSKARDLFLGALERSPAARAAFLEGACAGDARLRQRVEMLLLAHDEPGEFLSEAHPALSPTVTREPGNPLTGTVIAGRYKLLEEIGEGGMGTVWMAQQVEPVKRVVALQLIKAGLDSKQVIARFEAERQALALMDHAHIARVLDAGTTAAGRPYFVMELVKGMPITKYCDEHHLTPLQRLELFVPVCLAIQHAHQKGVIHRDIKPSNVLVAQYDGKPVPKVIDFGVAKAAGQPLTEKTLVTGFGNIVGTLEYMSPEQAEINQLDIDTRSDIYSLGVLLYELLTGSTPFNKKRLREAAWDEMLRIIREEDPPKPSTRLSDSGEALASISANRHMEPTKLTKLVRGELDWIVMKALEKDRNRRYETANGFAMDLQRYLADEPVQAGRPSAGYRLRKFVRRNKGPVFAASIVLLALVGGIVGTAFGLIRAEEKRQEAENSAQAEKAAKLEAQRRLSQIEKGVELFAGLVRGLNPVWEEQGAPPLYEQLRERASKAADELIGDAVGDAEAVARLQTLMGNTLRELGDAGKAIKLLERARATRVAKLGADHPDTLTTLDYLAGAYITVGKLPEAIALFEQVRDGRVKKLGADHPDTLSGLNNLADSYRTVGKLPEALKLFEQVRDAQMKKLGADHPATLYTLDNLACAYQDSNRLPEALALFEQVRETRVKKRGADHPETLFTLNNMAGAYAAAGKLQEAIALCEQVRDAQVKRLGPDHPVTLAALSNLAVAYRTAGKLPDAIALFAQAAAGIEKHQFQHESASRIIRNTIDAYERARQFDKAETWRRKWLAVIKKQVGADSIAYADDLVGLGLNLLDQKKWNEAEASLKECLAIREKTQPDLWSTFNAKSLLGRALLGQKKFAEAEPLLLAGYEGMKKLENQMRPQFRVLPLGDALERLVRLYDAMDKPVEAAKWRKEKEVHEKRADKK